MGASASAKNGKYYAVDAAHAKTIAQRFRFWPEAAMTYFGILVSPCKVCIEIPDARVLLVKDHELGTNDCRGWIRRSYSSVFIWPTVTSTSSGCPSRTRRQRAASRSWRTMSRMLWRSISSFHDRVASPSSRSPSAFASVPTAAGRISGQYSTGRVVIGIREISRDLQFSSSYTLVEHAPLNSIETEIKPIAMAAVEKVKTAIASNDFTELFRILGISEEVELLRSDETVTDPEHTSSEHTVVEAVLKADSTGYWVKHPFVNSHLQRTLARWAFKLCTAGGFTLPAFALADDGYLVLHDGRIYSGSDWIPEWHAITSLASERMLVVRYPIRTKGDLLPVKALNASDHAGLLMRHLEQAEVLDGLGGGCHRDRRPATAPGGDVDAAFGDSQEERR